MPSSVVAGAVSTVARGLRGWLAPRCFVCGVARGAPACDGCIEDFLSPAVRRCRSCGLRLPATASERCAQCLRHPPHFDATFVLGDYVAPLDGLVLALKFGHRLAVARVLGELLAERLLPALADDALLAAVPLAFERQAERGFNQAREIARALARALDRPLADDLLQRTRHGAPQEGLTRDARRRNVRGAFVARRNPGATTIVVVDDVMTSGATVDEIARVLKKAGAARVVNAVVARTP